MAEESNNRKKRVLIVDDHPIFRFGLAGLITEQAHLEVCGHADSAPIALDAMRRLKPDIVLVDLSLRGTNGIELIKLMKAEEPDLPRRHRLDRAENRIRRRVDADLVELPELTGGNEIIQPRTVSGHGEERGGQGRSHRGNAQAEKEQAGAGPPRPDPEKRQRLREREDPDETEKKTEINEQDGHGNEVPRYTDL